MSARVLLGLSLCLAPFPALQQDSQPGRPRAAPSGRGFLAVRAGTIHLVEEGRVLENGTLLVKDGKIQGAGSELELPADAEVVDYGPSAVIVPGLVAAYSSYASGFPSERTADPGLSALDGFDPYHVYADALSGGCTTAYLAPAENRLIAGTGALVKLGGEKAEARVLNATAAIHGAIDASARSTPGYWDPPVPATVDVGLGYAEPQLPKTTMGAVLALQELLDGVEAPLGEEIQRRYGKRTATDLGRLMQRHVPFRLGAVEPDEIRALLALASERRMTLILDKAEAARHLASEIAAAEAAVVYRVPYWPNSEAEDHGKREDDRWPSFDVPAALARAGVRLAIAGSSPRDLLFAARLASRGGLDEASALRAITLTPAELLGGAERVGSLRVGKDADLCVLNGPPLASGTSVLATWIEGKLVWQPRQDGRPTVIVSDELHVGDGEVLRPGELLIRDGKIVEVGRQVARPRGATVVRGRACMPGMIDAFGHLGLEGTRKVVNADYELGQIVEPGDEVDRKVALHGITTVVLTPRGAAEGGAPVMAYKPAAREPERQVVRDPVALRLRWADPNRLKSGEAVRALLEKAAEYRAKWLEYEQALAAWKPLAEPVPEEAQGDEKEEATDEKGEKKEEEPKAEEKAEDKQESEAGKDEKKEETKKDAEKKDKKKKGKKDEPAELEPDPITGLWQTEVVHPAGAAAAPIKLRLKLAESGKSSAVEGNLRCDALSSDLVEIEGYFEREKRSLELSGLGSRGWIALTAELKDEKLAGKLTVAGAELELALERKSKEYVVAGRKERRQEKPEPVREPKGKPREPRRDAKLEPLRRAMDGRAAVVVEVEGEADILACVEAFARHGIRPILHGAHDAYRVSAEIAGKVSGVLLGSPSVLEFDPERGTQDYRAPYAELQAAGIRVAFQSQAEEGAIDLPLRAAYAVASGMSPEGALRALTSDAAAMMLIGDQVGRLEAGLDADVLLLDGPPLDPATSVLRTWVNGQEVEAP